MSPKSFIQFNQEGTKILQVQVRCLQRRKEGRRQRNRTGPRGDSTWGGSPKKDWEKNVKIKSRKQKKPVKEREKQKVFEIMNTMPLIIQSNWNAGESSWEDRRKRKHKAMVEDTFFRYIVLKIVFS